MSTDTDTHTNTHPVMVRPLKGLHAQLAAIAAAEDRDVGPQALQFVKEGVKRYLAENPHITEQLQAQA